MYSAYIHPLHITYNTSLLFLHKLENQNKGQRLKQTMQTTHVDCSSLRYIRLAAHLFRLLCADQAHGPPDLLYFCPKVQIARCLAEARILETAKEATRDVTTSSSQESQHLRVPGCNFMLLYTHYQQCP